MMNRVNVAIIGIGSAGIQSICNILTKTNSNVTSIHNPIIPHLGIGESTNPTFVSALENGTFFNIHDNLDDINGTLKLGTKYKKWREHDFVNPLLGGNLAVHMDTFELASYVMGALKPIWGDKFNNIEGNVDNIEDNNDNVVVEVDGIKHQFDYVIDCRGFPSDNELNDGTYYFPEMMVNQAIVHNLKQTEDYDQYTGHTALKCGWVWNVPLKHRDSYGLQFNNNITTHDAAEKELAAHLNIEQEDLDNISFKFKPYYNKHVVNGRIIKNGNKAFFIEPLFANSLYVYNMIDLAAIDIINGAIPEEQANNTIYKIMNDVEDIITLHYKNGSIHDSDFWKKSAEISNNKITNSGILDRIRDIDEWIVNGVHLFAPTYVFDALGLRTIDKNMQFGIMSVND